MDTAFEEKPSNESLLLAKTARERRLSIYSMTSDAYRTVEEARAPKVAAMEYLCRAQEERERAEEQRREHIEKLRREKEEVDRERWAEHERLQARFDRQASLRSQASEAKRVAKETRQRREAIADFLVENGFTGVNTKRKKMFFGTYPLHVAAEKADADLVRYLLEEGADPDLRNSAGRTATQVARRKNKDGSHDDVLEALGEEL